MIRLHSILLLIVGSLLERSDDDNDLQHNISIGMFDDKIGLSIIGYAYDIKLSEKNIFTWVVIHHY